MTTAELTSQERMKKPEPNKFYMAEDFLRDFAHPVAYGFAHQFFLRTQMVVEAPGFVVPMAGRVFTTSWYVVDGNVCLYTDIEVTPEFQGTYTLDQIYIVEAWEDYGDDGHISMRFQGYVTIACKGSEFDLAKLVAAAQKIASDRHYASA